MVVTCAPGGCVHDYVPLYFGSVSPMLLGVINAKNVDQSDILYFEFPIDLLDRPDVIFTDASANTVVPPNFFSDPTDLDRLNWAEIDSKKWSSANEILRHQRMAELLVHTQLPIMAAARCVVWNNDVKAAVDAIVEAAGTLFPPIEMQDPARYHWFLDFQNQKRSSLVTGPRGIAQTYSAASKYLTEHRGQHAATAKFPNLKALLDGLRANFGCTSHTAELVGLKSANGVHKRTVDVHTQEVVAQLKSLPRFKALALSARDVVELAAYLHDIGKGPRSRWDNNNGLQKVDPNHPVGAMPMMAEILTQDVADLRQSDGDSLMKLVCYHDLVGDVLGRGRDEQQIVDVIDSREELDMLFALGQADATVLVETWWDDVKATALYTRCLAAIE